MPGPDRPSLREARNPLRHSPSGNPQKQGRTGLFSEPSGTFPASRGPPASSVTFAECSNSWGHVPTPPTITSEPCRSGVNCAVSFTTQPTRHASRGPYLGSPLTFPRFRVARFAGKIAGSRVLDARSARTRQVTLEINAGSTRDRTRIPDRTSP